MTSENTNITYQMATNEHIVDIINLYNTVYQGKYPDSSFTDYQKLSFQISGVNTYIFIALFNDKIIGAVHFLYSPTNKMAKAKAAVVLQEFRGQNTTQKLLTHGIEYLRDNTFGLEVVYATTRTVHKAAQVLTEKLGFVKLGIFPNVHKTDEYETHALTALFLDESLAQRYTEFKHHPLINNLFQIAATECHLPMMENLKEWNQKVFTGNVPDLEIINAPKFVESRYNKLAKANAIDLAFFPFSVPNVIITSSDQRVEVFANINDVDNHCVIVGVKIDREIELSALLLKVTTLLRNQGVRYLEMITRAHRVNIVEKMLTAKFIPCAYFPALELDQKTNKRYDYIIFSRSFEILDFSNIELEGIFELYLNEYINIWEKVALGKNRFKHDRN